MPQDRTQEQHVVDAAVTLLRHLVRMIAQKRQHAAHSIGAEIAERVKEFIGPDFWKAHGERLKAEIKRMIQEKFNDETATRREGDPPG